MIKLIKTLVLMIAFFLLFALFLKGAASREGDAHAPGRRGVSKAMKMGQEFVFEKGQVVN